MTDRWQVAQINIAKAMYPEGDERIGEFYARLDEINALADDSPGFVWRLQSESGNATDIEVSDDPMLIVNLSVWASVEALFDFAYKSAHKTVLAGRKRWFERPAGTYQALWWVPAGHQPSVEEGMARLQHLETHGPGEQAFTFKARFPQPGDTRGGDADSQA